MTRGFVINNLKYHHIKKLLYVFIQEAEAEKQSADFHLASPSLPVVRI